MTVGEMSRRLEELVARKQGDRPVVVLLQSEDGDLYAKGYVESLQVVIDHFPAEDGSDDLEKPAGTMLLLECSP